ncbi:MAG: hypothetical protein Q8K12_01015 [Thiobacillus sp.]|nr:hypothetical protein [Thiobacillus sp.]
MAIDEAGLPNGSVGQQVDEKSGADGESRFSVDDFRLRLDSPLFHRDGGMEAGSRPPQLRELTWEHVVRPTTQQALADAAVAPTPTADPTVVEARTNPDDPTIADELPPGLQPIAVSPAMSIESLLVHTRDLVGPDDEPPPRAPLPYDLSDGPTEGEPAVTEPSTDTVADADDTVADVAEAADVAVSYADTDTDTDPEPDDVGTGLPTLSALIPLVTDAPTAAPDASPPNPHIDSLLAALEQMEDRESPAPAEVLPPVEQPDFEPRVDYEPEPSQTEHASEQEWLQQRQVAMSTDVRAIEPASRYAVPVVGESAVEAELNRLAFLPDREDIEGPVEVPPIAHNDHPPAVPAPQLSQSDMYSPRQSAPAAPQSRINFADLASNSLPPPRRKKRHPLRKFLAFVVLIGLIGGGLFAAKKYLLDQQWEGDVKQLASDVEGARELSFDHAIPVSALPSGEYAIAVTRATHGITDENVTNIAGEWRALGLLTGPLDERSIGMSALADAPAFYDASEETIYVVEDLEPELYQFAMKRALTLALLDQEYGWGDRIADASPAVALGTRALYDGDALAVANELTTDEERAEIILQIFGLYTKYEIPPSPSPFATVVVGRLGVATRPYVETTAVEDRAAVEADLTISDGQVLDLRWLAMDDVFVPAAATSRGMLFWYHVLASRIDNDLAWQAALSWRGDSVSTVNSTEGTCVVATIDVTPALFDTATGAFQQWAASAPAASKAAVTSIVNDAGAQVTVNSCDPGEAVPTNDGRGRLSLGGAPLRAEQYRQLLAAQPALPASQAACAVYGGDQVTLADERGVIDPVSGWPPPAAHPTPDPNRLGCAPAAG